MSENRPAVITAEQFIEEKYLDKVADELCQVIYRDSELIELVIDVYPPDHKSPSYRFVPFREDVPLSKIQPIPISRASRFAVEWLDTPPASAPAVDAGEDKPSRVRPQDVDAGEGDVSEHHQETLEDIAIGLQKRCDALQAELAEIKRQLAAAGEHITKVSRDGGILFRTYDRDEMRYVCSSCGAVWSSKLSKVPHEPGCYVADFLAHAQATPPPAPVSPDRALVEACKPFSYIWRSWEHSGTDDGTTFQEWLIDWLQNNDRADKLDVQWQRLEAAALAEQGGEGA